MNTHPPADFAPLSYGTGLAIGLLLILGLPADSAPESPAPARSRCDPRLATVPVAKKLPPYVAAS